MNRLIHVLVTLPIILAPSYSYADQALAQDHMQDHTQDLAAIKQVQQRINDAIDAKDGDAYASLLHPVLLVYLQPYVSLARTADKTQLQQQPFKAQILTLAIRCSIPAGELAAVTTTKAFFNASVKAGLQQHNQVKLSQDNLRISADGEKALWAPAWGREPMVVFRKHQGRWRFDGTGELDLLNDLESQEKDAYRGISIADFISSLKSSSHFRCPEDVWAPVITTKGR